MSRPRIGVNCDVIVRDSGEDALRLNWPYAEGVVRAGGLPVPLAPVQDEALLSQQLDAIDGLLLTGGDDYDPALYGQEKHQATRLLHPLRSHYDLPLARAALERRLPILAICGGMQLVNIALGGTLAQHIPDHVPGALMHAQSPDGPTLHSVTVEPGSRLAAIVGEGRLETNSSHHQAVDSVAPAVRVVARADDGIVEALEGTGDAFLVAVQWHPERLLERPPHLALFQALVAAVR
ncbi:gamma-glutamyl-gamma-aminobutyrate hydrolase family protein [bacterium]|nr:gamma-glutamyl-gamma-aminobutyrate hydrolase family protein [bacterium]